MLDVEQPAGFRARVERRIEGPAPTSGWVASTSRWEILLPVAAAAIVILAVVAPWRAGAPIPATTVPPPTVAVAPPATTRQAPVVATTVPRTPPAPVIVAAVRPASVERRVVAAALTSGDTNFSANVPTFSAIDALEGPAAIGVADLASPPPPGLRSIEPAPMHIPALELPALPETPRERREE